MSSLYLTSIQVEVSVPVSQFMARLRSLTETELEMKARRIQKILAVASFSKDAEVTSLVLALEARYDFSLSEIGSRKAIRSKPRMYRLAA